VLHKVDDWSTNRRSVSRVTVIANEGHLPSVCIALIQAQDGYIASRAERVTIFQRAKLDSADHARPDIWMRLRDDDWQAENRGKRVVLAVMSGCQSYVST
jgi:hypothetical protein